MDAGTHGRFLQAGPREQRSNLGSAIESYFKATLRDIVAGSSGRVKRWREKKPG